MALIAIAGAAVEAGGRCRDGPTRPTLRAATFCLKIQRNFTSGGDRGGIVCVGRKTEGDQDSLKNPLKPQGFWSTDPPSGSLDRTGSGRPLTRGRRREGRDPGPERIEPEGTGNGRCQEEWTPPATSPSLPPHFSESSVEEGSGAGGRPWG